MFHGVYIYRREVNDGRGNVLGYATTILTGYAFFDGIIKALIPIMNISEIEIKIYPQNLIIDFFDPVDKGAITAIKKFLSFNKIECFIKDF